MARIEGFLSKLRGSLGGITFYEVNGVTYARERNSPKKKAKPSPLRKYSNDKFGMASKFLTPIKEPVKLGYSGFTKGMRTARNGAMSYITKNSFSGGGVDPLQIEPAQVKLSLGTLTGAQKPKISWKDDQHVRFTWENNTGQGSAKHADQVMVVVYDIKGKYAAYELEGKSRSQREQVIEISSAEKHRGKLHAYISFHRYNSRSKSREFSDSQYLGVV